MAALASETLAQVPVASRGWCWQLRAQCPAWSTEDLALLCHNCPRSTSQSCFWSRTHCLGINTVPSHQDTKGPGASVAGDAQGAAEVPGLGIPAEQLFQNTAQRRSGFLKGLFLLEITTRALPCPPSPSSSLLAKVEAMRPWRGGC